MAKSFTITTPASSLEANAKGHSQATFTVTNNLARTIIGRARIKSLGDTKPEWLLIAGETDRNFGVSTTQQFSVSFDAGPGTPAGKYQYRLNLLSPEGDLSEGPIVTVELAAATPPPDTKEKKKFPLWIILVIVGVLLLVGVVLIIVLR